MNVNNHVADGLNGLGYNDDENQSDLYHIKCDICGHNYDDSEITYLEETMERFCVKCRKETNYKQLYNRYPNITIDDMASIINKLSW